MWSLIHIPGWILLAVVILAIIGLKSLVGGGSGQEYKTELTELGKVALTILAALGAMLALALLLIFILVLLKT